MSKVIIPTIGRKIWLWRSGKDRAAYELAKLKGIEHPAVQPLDASICYTFGNHAINVTAADQNGNVAGHCSVPLIHEGEPWDEDTGKHCQWMPFQVGQAKAQAEAPRVTPAMIGER